MNNKYIMTFTMEPECGDIYKIGVTSYGESAPNYRADNDIDFYGEMEFDFHIIEMSYDKEEMISYNDVSSNKNDIVFAEFIRQCELRNLP